MRGRRKKIDATQMLSYIESPPSVDLRKDCVLLIPTHVNGNHWVATITMLLYYRHQQGVMHEVIVNSLYSGESYNPVTLVCWVHFILYCFQSMLILAKYFTLYARNISFTTEFVDVEDDSPE